MGVPQEGETYLDALEGRDLMYHLLELYEKNEIEGDLENLIKWKVVQGGMIPKIENCVDAVQNGVRGVVILDGRKPHSILHEIFSDKGSGTLIRE